MLTAINLDCYRRFRQYEMAEFGRVNLLVGRNNCGKTSLLEAVEFLVSKGSPGVLLRSPARRGEASPITDPTVPIHSWVPNIGHLFHGHDIRPGAGGKFKVAGSNGYDPLTVSVRPLTPEERNGSAQLFGGADEDDVPLGIEIAGSYLRPNPVMAIGWDGSLLSRDRLGPELVSAHRRSPGDFRSTHFRPGPTRFLAPRSLSAADMRSMWDRVQVTGRRSEIINALQLVVPELDSLHFLASDPARRFRDESMASAAGILADIAGKDRPVPFGSLGDGMRRILALSLSLIETAGGCLLADEIDSGLHWSLMQGLWEFIIRASQRSSVQVFATTHSLDCLRGLASLYTDNPDLASEVAVFKIDRKLPFAVKLGVDSVEAMTKHGLEIR